MRVFGPRIADSGFKLFLWAIGDILRAFFRSLASAFGMMLGGGLAGGVLGGVVGLINGAPLLVSAGIGAVAGFLLAAVVLYVLSVGSSWF